MNTQTCTEAGLEGDAGVFPISSRASLYFLHLKRKNL